MISIKKMGPGNYRYYLHNFIPKEEYPDLPGQMASNVQDVRIDSFALVRIPEGNPEWKPEVICLLGLFHQRVGAAEAWVIPGVLVDKYRCGFFKTVKRMIDYGFLHMGLHRIEMATDVKWKAGTKWAQKLGFQFEGVCRAYDRHLRDHNIFSKIKPGVR